MADSLKALNGYGTASMALTQQRLAVASQNAQGPTKSSQVEKASQQFEAMLAKQMIGSMWAAVPQGGMLSGSNEEEIYRDMLSDALAESMSKGKGMGIKAIVSRELSKDGKQ